MKFDSLFITELTAQARKMTQRECEYMANVGIRKELAGKYDENTIRVLEDIYWMVSRGKSFEVAA